MFALFLALVPITIFALIFVGAIADIRASHKLAKAQAPAAAQRPRYAIDQHGRVHTI